MKADKRKSVLRHPDLAKFTLKQPGPDLSDPWPSLIFWPLTFQLPTWVSALLSGHPGLQPPSWHLGFWFLAHVCLAGPASPPHPDHLTALIWAALRGHRSQHLPTSFPRGHIFRVHLPLCLWCQCVILKRAQSLNYKLNLHCWEKRHNSCLLSEVVRERAKQVNRSIQKNWQALLSHANRDYDGFMITKLGV